MAGRNAKRIVFVSFLCVAIGLLAWAFNTRGKEGILIFFLGAALLLCALAVGGLRLVTCKTPATKKRLLVPRFLFVVCFAAGAWMIFHVFCLLAVGLRSRYTWETTEGTIAKADAQIHDTDSNKPGAPDSKTTTIELAFDYSVSGQRFQGSSLNVDELLLGSQLGTNSKIRLRRLLETYPVGAKVSVYYDPSDPGKAVLERGVPVLELAFWFALGSMFLFPAWIINNISHPFSWVGDAACLPITWVFDLVGYALSRGQKNAIAVVS